MGNHGQTFADTCVTYGYFFPAYGKSSGLDIYPCIFCFCIFVDAKTTESTRNFDNNLIPNNFSYIFLADFFFINIKKELFNIHLVLYSRN